MMKSSQINPKQPMKCPKPNHNKQFMYFKFSKEMDEILQCLTCNFEDPQNDKKIIIDDLLNLPAFQIMNYPPLEDKQQSKTVRKTMEKSLKQNLDQFFQQAITQIDQTHDKAKRTLEETIRISRKECIQKFQAQFKFFVDISDYYNPEQIVKIIKQFQNQEISFNELFQEQLKFQETFYDQEKLETVLQQNVLSEQIESKLKNLKTQIEEQVEQFKFKFEYNMTQFFEQDTVPNAKQQIPQPNIFNKQLPKQQNSLNFTPKFHSSNNPHLIKISNNNKTIKFNNQESEKFKFLYTNILDKTKTHTLRLKIDFNCPNNIENNHINDNNQDHPYNNKNQLQKQEEEQTMRNQYLDFNLIDGQNKDSSWKGYNFLKFNSHKGDTFAGYQDKKFKKQGMAFPEFWRNNQSILTIKFNYQQKIFEAYDDEKKCQIKCDINQDLIKQNMRLGIAFYNNICVGDTQIQILDYQYE